MTLRYRLLPYLYTLAHRHTISGAPILRPLFWNYPSDPALGNDDRAFLVGDDLLVAPVVTSGARAVTFRLPEGDWVDYWTDEIVRGGREVTLGAPLDRIPVLIRSGSILPLGPEMQYSDERPVDTVTFVAYPRASTTTGTSLYEDDGSTLAYRTGAQFFTSLTQSWATTNGMLSMVFDLTQSGAGYSGMPLRRTVILDVRHQPIAPLTVSVNEKFLRPYSTWEDVLAAGEGGIYDAATKRLRILFRVHADSSYRLLLTDVQTTGIAERPLENPAEFWLGHNYPNPFNPETNFEFRIANFGLVKLAIYDLLGREVAVVVDAELSPGHHSIRWSAEGLTSGVYLCRLTAGGMSLTRRIVLLR
jgi:hypothetical protein